MSKHRAKPPTEAELKDAETRAKAKAVEEAAMQAAAARALKESRSRDRPIVHFTLDLSRPLSRYLAAAVAWRSVRCGDWVSEDSLDDRPLGFEEGIHSIDFL